MLKPYQKKIIDLLLEQEMLLARLYTTYSKKFQELQDFWRELAKEERQHAKWIQQLYEAEKDSLVLFDEGRIKTYTMKTFISGLEEALGKVELKEFDSWRAIVYACDIERSLIEKNVFSHFYGLTENAINVLKLLKKHTDDHLNRLEDLRSKQTCSIA